MKGKKHEVFLTGDSEFLDAIEGDLSATSRDAFNLWIYESRESKAEYDVQSGKRSTLNRQFNRAHPKSLLPDVDNDHIVLCIDHGFARIAECLLRYQVQSIHQDIRSKPARDAAIKHLESNINKRKVRSGNFSLVYNGVGVPDSSLNKSHAMTIMAPPEEFQQQGDTDLRYSHILDGVFPPTTFSQKLPSDLQQLLQWPTDSIGKQELEKLIWQKIYQMYKISRQDPHPQLKPGASAGSEIASDYVFGVQPDAINQYVHHADMFHRLMLFR